MSAVCSMQCRLTRWSRGGLRHRVAWSRQLYATPTGWRTETEPWEPVEHHMAELQPMVDRIDRIGDIGEPWQVERGTVRWSGATHDPVERDFALVQVREHWHCLSISGEPVAPVRLTAVTPTDDSPLFLGPSAVLQLLDQVLCSNIPGSGRLHPSIDAVCTLDSPYPPRGLAPWLLSSVRDRPVVAAGYPDREAISALRGPWPRLPDGHGAPVGALSTWDQGGLRVECSERSSQTMGVMVESLTPLTWRSNPGLCQARIAIMEANGCAVVPGQILLRLDARALLNALDGALSPAKAALLRDPVQRDRHGWAPILATTSTLGDWRATR